MDVAHSDYWPPSGFGVVSTTSYLTPIGSVQLRITKVGNYPDNSGLEVILKSHAEEYDNRTFRTPEARDTTVTLRGFGGQQNKIEWRVMRTFQDYSPITNGVLDALPVPKLDTLKNITLGY